jgi:hypothetical protein
MEELNRLIEKYDEARLHQLEYEKKAEKYKDRIEKLCKEKNIDNYENNGFIVKKHSQARNVMLKKTVPTDIWDKYATIYKIEFFTIKKKKDGQ